MENVLAVIASKPYDGADADKNRKRKKDFFSDIDFHVV